MERSVFRTLLCCFCLLAATSSASAQWFVKVNGSYNVQAAQSIIETRTVADSTGFTTVSPIFTTLGGGSSFGLDAGFMISDHAGIELGFNYLIGTQEEALVQETPITDIQAIAYTRQGRINLGGVLETGGDPWNVFVDAGLIIPIFGITTLDLDFESSTFNTDQFTKTENEGAFSVGFYGGVGVEYKLNDWLGISLDARFNSLRIKVARATIVEKVDRLTGEDLLPDTPTINVITEYVNELTPESNNLSVNPDVNQDMPLQDLSYVSNYSNGAFSLGLGFYFGGSEKTERRFNINDL